MRRLGKISSATAWGLALLLGAGAVWTSRAMAHPAIDADSPRPRPAWDARLELARRININAATRAELMRLPGIGPALAGAIVEDRERHGPFASVDGLQRVRGIGPGLMRLLAPYLGVTGD